MGWSFGWDSKKDVVDMVTQDSFYAMGYTHLKSLVVGSKVWSAIQKPDGEIMIALTLVKGSKGEWGYKSMSDSMGPYYFNCPLSLINMTTPSSSETANDWRRRVREFHEQLKNRPAYAVGQRWEFGGEQYELEQPAGPRRGWLCWRIRDGQRFRMPAKHLAAATYVTPATQNTVEAHDNG